MFPMRISVPSMLCEERIQKIDSKKANARGLVLHQSVRTFILAALAAFTLRFSHDNPGLYNLRRRSYFNGHVHRDIPVD